MKQLEVQIMGQSYLLGAPDGGQQRLLSAVEKVDAAMCKIRDAGKVKARDRIAVLAALNVAFDSNDAAQARASAALAASSANASHSASTSGSTSTQSDSHHTAANDQRIAQLISRLDHALAAEGQLL